MFIFIAVVIYGYLLYRFKPYDRELYTKIDIYSTASITLTFYLGFVAYENYDNLGVWISSILLLTIINIIFIYWCLSHLLVAY